MFLTYSVLLQAVLLVAGLLWCKAIFSRLRDDIEELRSTKDNIRRGVVVFFWVVTAAIIFLMGRFLWRLVGHILGALS